MPVINAGSAVGAASYALTTRNREKFLRDAEERISRLAAGEPRFTAGSGSAGAGGDADGEGSIWDKRDVRKLRARKLLSLADEESLTTTDLRALFRLLDEDGNHEISALEIQSGLLLLGFQAAADPVALSRFLLDVDSDRTGTVTEDEFLTYFNSKTRAEMERDINSYVVSRSLITATWYGADDAAATGGIGAGGGAGAGGGGARTLTTEFVQGKDLRAWMAALPEGRGRLWLDVNGYDAECFGVLAEALGKPEHELVDAVLIGDARVDLAQGPSGPRAEVVLHTRELSVSPIRSVPRAFATYMPGPLRTLFEMLLGSDGEEDGILGNMDLVSRTAITEQMPAISLEQAAMIVVDEKTLVTLRLPAFGSEADLAHLRAAPAASGSVSARVAPDPAAHHAAAVAASFASTEDPLAHDPSVIRRCYERVRQDMARAKPTVTHLFNSSAKALAITLTDTILQQNHLLRDNLQDWEHVLERSIKRQPNSTHLPHLNAIDIITRLYTGRIQLLCNILDPGTWAKADADDAAAAAAEDESAAPGTIKRTDSAKLLLERAAVSPSSGSAGEGAGAGAGAGDDLARIAATRAVRSMVEGTPAKRATSSRRFPVGDSAESQRPGGLLRLSTAAAGGEGDTSSRAAYFAAFVEDFIELSKDLRSVLMTLEDKRRKIEDLKALLAGLKADFMNKTLFVLTVITAVSVPITFLTGLFGMNFKDMWELVPNGSTDIDDMIAAGYPVPSVKLPLSGYRFFWVLLVTIVASLVALMWRFGLFRALQ